MQGYASCKECTSAFMGISEDLTCTVVPAQSPELTARDGADCDDEKQFLQRR